MLKFYRRVVLILHSFFFCTSWANVSRRQVHWSTHAKRCGLRTKGMASQRRSLGRRRWWKEAGKLGTQSGISSGHNWPCCGPWQCMAIPVSMSAKRRRWVFQWGVGWEIENEFFLVAIFTHRSLVYIIDNQPVSWRENQQLVTQSTCSEILNINRSKITNLCCCSSVWAKTETSLLFKSEIRVFVL